MESYEIAITENMKNEFKTWLKKYQKQLRLKHQSLKSRLKTKQAKNKELKIKIDKLMETSIDISVLILDAIPNKAQANIEGIVEYLKNKLLQLKCCKEAMDAKVKEETMRIRKQLCDILTKDNMTLKPYYEVEEAIKQLTLKIEGCLTKQHNEGELYIQTLKKRAQYFLQIKQDITMLEPIEHEMRLKIQKCNKNLEEKMNLLKVQNVPGDCHESIEAKELLNDINNLKSQVKK